MKNENPFISVIEFKNVYSHPGDMECVVREFHAIFDKTAEFLKPVKINTTEGLGWVLLELLNNAVRSPVSLAMNRGVIDINETNFFTDIIIRKSVCDTDKGKSLELSVMNSGEYSENVIKSMQEILAGGMTILDCEERFMLKGSYTGNGGMGIILSKKQIENALGGTLSLEWHDGYYDFTIRFTVKDI